jgi:hypothetical protein
MLGTMLALPVAPAFASNVTDEVGYTLAPVLPENQNNAVSSYFNLKVEPGQTQDLGVNLANTGSKPITLSIQAISASTNGNGLIDYSTPDVRDQSLRYPFSSLAKVLEPQVTLQPGEVRRVTIQVTMPQAGYDGVILGGINVSKVADDAAAQSDAISITNRYVYVLGVVLAENDMVVRPAFEPIEAVPGTRASYIAVTHNIRNAKAAIVKDLPLSIEVTREGSTQVIKKIETIVSIAPNSVLPYDLFWDGQIEPGKYISHVTLGTGASATSFDMPFGVSLTDAEQINVGSVDKPLEGPAQVADLFSGVPLVTFIAAVISASLITATIVTLFILLILCKRRKKQEEEEEQAR